MIITLVTCTLTSDTMILTTSLDHVENYSLICARGLYGQSNFIRWTIYRGISNNTSLIVVLKVFIRVIHISFTTCETFDG